jgi:hypothetical protein
MFAYNIRPVPAELSVGNWALGQIFFSNSVFQFQYYFNKVPCSVTRYRPNINVFIDRVVK